MRYGTVERSKCQNQNKNCILMHVPKIPSMWLQTDFKPNIYTFYQPIIICGHSQQFPTLV